MTGNVRALNRAQKLNLIKLTMLALQAKLYYLQENYNTYHENYSNEAMQLYNASFRFDSAVNNIIQSEDMDYLDDNGLTVMAELSLQVSELYKLGVRTPDDQKEYEATIKQFKEDVYTEALKRLEANKKETNVYETDLLAEAKSKGGKYLSPVYEYYDLQKQIDKNQYQIDYAQMMGNNEDYSKYYAVNKELKYKAKVIKENTTLLSHLPYEETIVKDIRNLCNKIRKAQGKVEKLLNKGKYPIWELNPVIAYIFETNEFYTPDKQEYIFDWIKEHERIDQLIDVFKNAIPIALSVMCFFMPGGVSIAMLILQGANAVAGAAAAYDDIQDAGAVRNMAYSQYPVSEEAQKIIDNADLSAIERNYAMAILSGAFTMLDFAECIKIARKFGIGDDVMKYFAQGRKFRLSVDETEELVRKAGKTSIAVKKGTQKSIKFVNGQITGEITNALKTEPGTAFFWSGCAKVDPSSGKLLVSGDEVAAEIANKCGGTTLETQIKVNNIEMPKWDFDVPESIKAWEDTSASYAKQVSGDVRAIVGQKLRDGNIWENIELPRLMQNPNVTKITTIDPDTLAETVIFERKAGTIYVKPNETLIKSGKWDEIIESIGKTSSVNKNEISEAARQYLETLNKDSVQKIISTLPVEKVDRITSVPKKYVNYLNDDNIIKILDSDKYQEVIDSFNNIKKKKHINRIICETENINDLPKILNEPTPARVVNKIPAKYEARFKAGFAKKTDTEKSDIIEAIEDLYGKYGKSRTMQDHHWIEQSRIRNKTDFPFLQQPPMRMNLLKDDTNLSLIVGHNGGHSGRYNNLLDKKLIDLKQDLIFEYGVDYMKKPTEISDIVNSRITNIIKELKEEVDGKEILNNISSYVIDFID